MKIENLTGCQVILLLLTAVSAIFLARFIVRIIYRKSHLDFRKDDFDKEE